MSAYKEKMLAEKRIAGLKVWREALLTDLDEVNAELRQAEQDLAEAEKGIKWEAENDR